MERSPCIHNPRILLWHRPPLPLVPHRFLHPHDPDIHFPPRLPLRQFRQLSDRLRFTPSQVERLPRVFLVVGEDYCGCLCELRPRHPRHGPIGRDHPLDHVLLSLLLQSFVATVQSSRVASRSRGAVPLPWLEPRVQPPTLRVDALAHDHILQPALSEVRDGADVRLLDHSDGGRPRFAAEHERGIDHGLHARCLGGVDRGAVVLPSRDGGAGEGDEEQGGGATEGGDEVGGGGGGGKVAVAGFDVGVSDGLGELRCVGGRDDEIAGGDEIVGEEVGEDPGAEVAPAAGEDELAHFERPMDLELVLEYASNTSPARGAEME